MYEKIPWHVSRNKNEEEFISEVEFYLKFIRPLIKSHSEVLELGCGTGRVINKIGEQVKQAWGIDTTLIKSQKIIFPNVHLIEDDVTSFDLGNYKFDLIYSLHLIEHLHPDDINKHIKCIYDHLKPNGIVFIATPHSYSGPHDISKYFDDYPTGFHLKEYTYLNLYVILKEAGFKKIKTQILVRRKFKINYFLFKIGLVNVRIIIILERILSFITNRRLQKNISNYLKLNNIYIYANK